MSESTPNAIVPAPPVPSMLSEAQLIDDICEAVSVGASDAAICRVLGIRQSTMSDWKKKGREGIEPYRTFYIRYQHAAGDWEINLLREIRDPKWHLTHNPRTKNQYAEVRYMKEEHTNVEKLSAKKDAIGVEIDRFFEDNESGEDDSEDSLSETVETTPEDDT